MPGTAKLNFLETTRWRLILLAPVFALIITILAIKAYSEGWFEARHALDLHQQPAVLFFNRKKGCECAKRVYQAAKEQVKHWPEENRQGVQLIQIDLDRRPDLGEQFDVIRVPSLLLIEPTGRIIYRQDDVETDAIPLDLSTMEKEIGELLGEK